MNTDHNISMIAFFLENGIIDIDSLAKSSKEELMNNVTNNIISKVHKYRISVSTDGRYTTFVPDSTRPHGRRQVRKKSAEDLNKFLLEYYACEIKSGGKTFADLYFEWIEYKKQFCFVENVHKGLSPTTIRRYERDYNNYLADSELSRCVITNITPIQLEMMLGKIIEKHGLIESCASNIVGYVRQVFAYGRRAGYIKENPCEYVDRRLVLSRCVTKVTKQDSERVLTINEMKALKDAVLEHEKKHPYYAPDYGIELAMMCGMRVGEIAALRWRSIDEHYIHVDESEHRYDYSDRPSELVIGEPKNQKHRLIPITDEMRELFFRIRSLNAQIEGDFVFVKENGQRCTGHDIGCAIDRRAKEADIKKTSVHGVRRTVSSILRTKLPVRTVANLLGHLEQTNEEHYNYDFYEDSAKLEALSSISQLSTNVLIFSEEKEKAKTS